MSKTITPFLMFTGQAEEAMQFYIATFPNSHMKDVERYGPDGPGEEGTVIKATISLNGHDFMCIDSPAVHDFSFTPSTSYFVACESAEEAERLFNALSADGVVMMPLDEYPFAKRYAWVADRFGVSWQLSFE